MNIFIAGSMLNPAVITSVPKTIGIHWFNQSYNAGVNYANRNASSEVPQERLVCRKSEGCRTSSSWRWMLFAWHSLNIRNRAYRPMSSWVATNAPLTA
jgi:hypothetical protein